MSTELFGFDVDASDYGRSARSLADGMENISGYGRRIKVQLEAVRICREVRYRRFPVIWELEKLLQRVFGSR